MIRVIYTFIIDRVSAGFMKMYLRHFKTFLRPSKEIFNNKLKGNIIRQYGFPKKKKKKIRKHDIRFVSITLCNILNVTEFI